MTMPFTPTTWRHQRLLAGLTQRQLAERLGVALGTVRYWENGRRRPRPHHQQRLARLLAASAPLDATPDDLWLTCAEAARRRGVSRQAIQQAIQRGTLPSRRWGHDHRIRAAVLAAWRPRRRSVAR
jgi:excisionase family DNA binding protein